MIRKTALVDFGGMADPHTCLNANDECSGPVELHTLDGLSFWPRCQYHFDSYLDRYEKSQGREYQGDTIPDWFNPDNAGEQWEEDE